MATILSMGTATAGIACALGFAPAEKGGGTIWPPASAHVARTSSGPSAGSGEAAVVARSRTLYRAQDGLFYVNARVNGFPVKFLVDTGATMVVLTPADAQKIGIVPDDAAEMRKMETAAGLSAVRSLTLDKVEVEGHKVEGVEAAIMPRGLGVSLLGQNLLSQLGTITLSGDELYIG